MLLALIQYITREGLTTTIVPIPPPYRLHLHARKFLADVFDQERSRNRSLSRRRQRSIWRREKRIRYKYQTRRMKVHLVQGLDVSLAISHLEALCWNETKYIKNEQKNLNEHDFPRILVEGCYSHFTRDTTALK